VLLTMAGVAVALGEKAAGSPAASTEWIGEIAVFASALCGAACSVLYRPYLARYPTLPVSAFAMLASVGFLAVLAVSEGFFGALPRFSAGGWLAVLFIGAGSGIGYYLWLWALHHASATEVTVFLALSPITAAWLGALVLGEEASPASALGLALVALGLWLAGCSATYAYGVSALRRGMTSAVKRSMDAIASASRMSPNIRRHTK
jgi:drug/metabolite transporter (DMT)-like permease